VSRERWMEGGTVERRMYIDKKMGNERDAKKEGET
jgi:hypothetical protein